MLCFANVAVHVNDDYQIIFPPSTQFWRRPLEDRIPKMAD